MNKLENNIISITDIPYSEIERSFPKDCDHTKVKSALESIIKKAAKQTQQSEEPWLMNISGIPGSGKSTYIANNKNNYKNYVVVAFDTIMENPALPYTSEAKQSQLTAFKRWEQPAKIAGYELLKRLVTGQKNIIFEHSSSIKEHVSLFETLLESGYEIHYKYIDISIAEAEKRIAKRERKVPPSYLIDRKEALDVLRKTYKKISTTYEIVK